MKYIKKFENHAAYETAESGLILPNVSLCAQENEVHYNPFTCESEIIKTTYEYVDLGLPSGVKWANKNIGALTETDYGQKFQWGDIQGFTHDQIDGGCKKFWAEDYKYSKNGGASASDMSKYNNTDYLVTLEASDDAAVANMGGSWRMPTQNEFTELLNNTDKDWTTIDGINGYKFTNRADASKYVFFPAAGSCYYGGVYNVGSYGYYWSSSLNTSSKGKSMGLRFYDGNCSNYYYDRNNGWSVRGVIK